MNLRCVVTVNNTIESVFEGQSSLVFAHIEESFKSYNEDDVEVTITPPVYVKENDDD